MHTESHDRKHRQKVLITGGSGLAARALTEALASHWSVFPLGHHELDITSPEQVRSAFDRIGPNVVINCAAHADVDWCEQHREEARNVHVRGPESLASECAARDCDFVLISTDYVYDGEKREAYTIDDVPAPISVYGETKLAGEVAAREAFPETRIVRISALYGRGGKSFASRLPAMARSGETIRAIDDNIVSPTYAPDLAKRIAEILRTGAHGTFHVTNSGATSWFEFAREALRILEQDPARVLPIRLNELKRPARRPRNCEMQCLLSEELGLPPLRPWAAALREFLQPG